MTKVLTTDLRVKKKSNNRPSVLEKRVLGADGKPKTVRILDAGSDTFGEDLLYVFGKNVAKARRENKRIFGVADIAVAEK